MTSAFRSPQRGPFLQVSKSAIATVGAWLVAGWLIPGPLPVFAAIAALLVVQPSLNQSFSKAIERSIGVIVGVLIASVLGILFQGGTWVILVSVVVALIVAWGVKMTAGTANQVAISALLVLALGAATPSYAVDRIIETLIGAVIGIIINVALVPPVAVGPAHERIDALGGELAASLDRLADALARPQTPATLAEILLQARLMRPMRDAADAAISTAEESLALNPRAAHHRAELSDLRALLDRFTPIVTQVIGMTRAFCDRYDASLGDEPTLRAIAEQLRRAAHDVRLALHRAETDAPPTATEPPALTRPLMVATPASDHWILVGSLLVDLHRIHETLGEPSDGPNNS